MEELGSPRRDRRSADDNGGLEGKYLRREPGGLLRRREFHHTLYNLLISTVSYVVPGLDTKCNEFFRFRPHISSFFIKFKSSFTCALKCDLCSDRSSEVEPIA